MSWKDRLAGTIKLTSPKGSEFEALWKGNARRKVKKLGVFEFPEIKGFKVQDLDIGGTNWPLTIFFEGENHDVESDRFWRSCDERGKWSIIHPVRGTLSLQLVSITEGIEPVDSANITEHETIWIESEADGKTISKIEKISQLDAQVNVVNEAATEQFARNARQSTAEERRSLISSVNKVLAAAKKAFFVVQRASIIPPELDAILRSITSTLTQTEGLINGDLLAGQIQSLVQTYGLAQETVSQSFSTFNTFIEAIFEILPGVASPSGISIVAIQELTLAATIAAVSRNASVGGVTTRKEVIDLIDEYQSFFKRITDKLDETQELYRNNSVDSQYFSQSNSCRSSLSIVHQAIDFLLTQIFDLSIEKKIILGQQRAPIEITITEYGTLGENDRNLDLLISSNKLKGNEIRLLPAGKELAIYA